MTKLRLGRWIVETVGVALLYVIGAQLGFLAAIQPGNVTLLWVPSGVAVASLLTMGTRPLVGLLLGSFGVNFWFLHAIVPKPLGAVVAMAIAVGSVAQAILVACFVKRYRILADLIDYRFYDDPESAAKTRQPLVKEALLFPLIVILSCFVASFVGVGSLFVINLVPNGAFIFTWATWWLGDALGILVVVPPLLVLVRHGTAKPPGHTVLHLTRATGFCLSVGLAQVAFSMELQRIAVEFEVDAAPIARNFGEIIRVCRSEVRSIADFMEASEEVTRDEFRTFTRSRLTDGAVEAGLQALTWNLRVLGSDRIAHESAVQSAGVPGFRITEQDEHANLVAAKDRSEYIVVKYAEPQISNESVLGFDVASEPARLAAIMFARDTGQVIATAPVTLVQTRPLETGILLFQPIYRRHAPINSVDERRANLESFAVGAFRMVDTVNAAMGESFPGIDLYLFDLGLSQHERLVYARSGDLQAEPSTINPRLEPSEVEVDMHYAKTIDTVGRRWRMVAKPTRSYIMSRRTGLPWELLTLSLVFSMVIVVYLAQRLELEVERGVLLAAEKKQRLFAETSTELTRELLLKSERLASELTILNETQKALAWKVDRQAIYDLMGNRIQEIFHVEQLEIATYDRQDNRLCIHNAFNDGARIERGKRPPEAWESYALESKQSVNMPRDIERISGMTRQTTINAIGLPFTVERDVLGIVILRNITCKEGGIQASTRMLETLVGHMSVALETAWLYEQLRAEQALLARRVEERTADLRVANEELTRAATAKDEFLANMSHELRTPLNSVLGFSEILLEGIQGPINDKQRTFLQYIGSSGRHLLDLINDILDIAKSGAGKLQLQMEAVNVYEVCKSSLRLVEETTNRKGIALSLRADGPDEVFAWLDPRRLKQILLNLLGNAVKFTPEGGSVIFEVHADPHTKVLRFAVRDTGPGIASDDMCRLFQPFSQLDSRLSREHEGTGLGLMIVRRMVDMLQGSVTVESELGRGSCFSVALPWKLPERPSRQEMAVLSRLPPQSQRERLLLVEDNENNIALMTEYLQSVGYRIRIARDGHQALDRAIEWQPELILMDVQLPRINGLEVTRRLRQMAMFRTTPIVVVTALVMPGDRERCMDAGANDYLSKPVPLEGLALKIRMMLAGAVDEKGPTNRLSVS